MKFKLGKSSRDKREQSYRSISFSCDISDYVLLDSIGSIDDISHMYLAIYTPLHVPVALKYTDLTVSPDLELIEELTTVVSNTQLFRHPCLLPYFKSFVENERLWTVTLPMKAGSCRSLLTTYFPLGFPEKVIATLMKYVLCGLEYLHSQGIIHNDIRAENVHVNFNGDVRLVGLHQLTYTSQARRSVFDFSGLPEWISPELLQTPISHDPRSDIYSLGIMAMEMAFGKTPFSDWPPLKILVGKLKYGTPLDKKKWFTHKPVPLSHEFFDFTKACVQKRPLHRPTVKQLLKHPFLKQARGEKYLVHRLIRDTKLEHKFKSTAIPFPLSSDSSPPPFPEPPLFLYSEDGTLKSFTGVSSPITSINSTSSTQTTCIKKFMSSEVTSVYPISDPIDVSTSTRTYRSFPRLEKIPSGHGV